MEINGLPVELVIQPNNAYVRLQKAWEVIEDSTSILTPSIIKKYVFQSQNEGDDTYNQRCNMAYRYFPDGVNSAIVKTMGILGGISLDDDCALSFRVAAQTNIDGIGSDLQTYVSFSTRKALLHGWTWHLVDFPRPRSGETLLHFRAKKPKLVNIPATDIVNWNYNDDTCEFDLIVIKEFKAEYVKNKKEMCKYYRILVPGAFYLIKETDNDKNPYELVDEGKTGLDLIPICIQLGNSNLSSNILEEIKPPFYQLALECFDVTDLESQVRRNLFDHNLPMKMVILPPNRVVDKNSVNPFSYGPDKALIIEHGGDAKIIEPTGVALSVTLNKIEEKLTRINETLNGISIVSKQGNTPVVEAIFRADTISAMIDAVARSLISTYDNILRFWCMFTMEQYKTQVFSLPKSNNKLPLSPEITKILIDLESRSVITRDTLLKILKDGRILPEEMNILEEIEELDKLEKPSNLSDDGEFYAQLNETEQSEVESESD